MRIPRFMDIWKITFIYYDFIIIKYIAYPQVHGRMEDNVYLLWFYYYYYY